MSVLPTPTVQGLSRQLVVQVVLHMESTHLALAQAGYSYDDLRKLGFTARLLERFDVRR